jgi:hypothetical protein
VGSPHKFSVVIDAKGSFARGWSPPPECPEHPGSHVVRNGTYGKTTAKPRQRYLCRPADGSPAHSITPVLARDHVHEGHERCDHCDEHRGVHHGETTAAWSHSWNSRVVAEALERLSRGDSYAEVSQWARRRTDTDAKRVRRVPRDGDLVVADRSDAARVRRNAWHTAADWVEAFGPVVFEHVEQQLRDRAAAERARLDALLADGAPLDRPQVLLLDDVPVYGRTLDRAARRDDGFFLLVAAEQLDVDGVGRPRLRLVRAMPKSNTAAWRLVFDELGYDPDVVVADAGTGIGAAIRAHFDPARTRLVPSLWHVTRKVEEALSTSSRATVATPAGKRLIDPLEHHLRLLSRGSGVLADEAAWAGWWDKLETLVVTHRCRWTRSAPSARPTNRPSPTCSTWSTRTPTSQSRQVGWRRSSNGASSRCWPGGGTRSPTSSAPTTCSTSRSAATTTSSTTSPTSPRCCGPTPPRTTASRWRCVPSATQAPTRPGATSTGWPASPRAEG